MVHQGGGSCHHSSRLAQQSVHLRGPAAAAAAAYRRLPQHSSRPPTDVEAVPLLGRGRRHRLGLAGHSDAAGATGRAQAASAHHGFNQLAGGQHAARCLGVLFGQETAHALRHAGRYCEPHEQGT